MPNRTKQERKRMKRFIIAIAIATVVLVAACEPSVNGTLEVSFDYPFCPTTDSLYVAADSVPLGCPVPPVPGP